MLRRPAGPPHELVPFARDPRLAGLGVRAGAVREGARLWLAWLIDDPGGRVALGPVAPATQPARRERLWEHTCVEAFIAPGDGTPYWELNVSPSGDWNVYRFERERSGMAPETRIAGLAAFGATAGPGGGVAIAAELDLSPVPELADAGLAGPGSAGGGLALGLAAVLGSVAGERSYWALRHAGEVPDFHRRESFVVRL